MKQITFTYKDVDYTLEFSKRTVQALERSGFNQEELSSKPTTMIPMLFAGAFMLHHKNTKQELINEIYNRIPNKVEFVGKLAECYAEPINAMLDEPETDEGNVNWGTNF